MAKRVPALVTVPTFVNGVLHLPGETAYVDLDELGVTELSDEKTPGLRPAKAGDESIQPVEVADFAPAGEGAIDPQQIPPGSKISGTGRTLSPATGDQDELSVEMTPPAVVKEKSTKG